MIAYMDQITVVGRKGIAHDLLTALQSLGVVQVDPLESADDSISRMALSDEEKSAKDDWDAAVARSASLLDALGLSSVKAAAKADAPSSISDINEYLKSVGTQVDQLLAERGELHDELDVAQVSLPLFREVAPSLAHFDESQFLEATAFLVPAESFDELKESLGESLGESFELTSQPSGKELLVTAVTVKASINDLKAAISRAGYAEISLPDSYKAMGFAKATHTMEERVQALPKRLEVIDAELTKLGAQHGAKLGAVSATAVNNQTRLARLEDMASTRYGLALRGWMPSSERSKVVEGLKKQFGDDIIVDTRAADDHHDHNVPVLLANPKWVKPFEGLLALFAPPKYGNFDPSLTLAVFFPFFFGMVLGDIGFGLMFAGLAWWMRQRGAKGKELDLGPLGVVISAKALAPLTTVIFWCSGWAIFFGILFGEFFGNLLEKWPASKPIFYTTLHHEPGYGVFPIALFRVEDYTPLLITSLLFGIIQVLGGWGIRVYYGLKHNDMKHVWEGIGMIGGLTGLIIFAWGYLTGNVNGFVTFLLFVGLAVFLAGVVMSRVFLMLIELPANGGAILSYLRLFAVGLSAAIVANLATNLGYAIGGSLPIIGPILGILVGFMVHMIAIALTIIGHTLQPLRLNYVEFFTKFGFYDESGRPYQPFRLLGGK